MDGFDRWIADGTPPATPGMCRYHHVPETVMSGGHLSQAGQEHFPVSVCPRCGFEDPDDMLTALWAVHDGTAWRTDDVRRRFQLAWLDRARAEGYNIAALSAELDPAAGSAIDAPSGWPLIWAFRVLNPSVTEDEAQHLYESTTILRRRGYGHDDLAAFPYTDLAALRALSADVLGRWEAYHAALWAQLGPEDQARVIDVDFRALFDDSELEDAEGSDRTQFSLVHVFGPGVSGYVDSVLAAHRHVVEVLGIPAPSSHDRFQCSGDSYGDLGLDVPLGLRDWRLAWR